MMATLVRGIASKAATLLYSAGTILLAVLPPDAPRTAPLVLLGLGLASLIVSFIARAIEYLRHRRAARSIAKY